MLVTDKPVIKRRRKIVPNDFSENHVQLIHGGHEYFNLLKLMIGEARETIHLQTYIFDDDATGSEIAEALIDAANRNVKVYLLPDGYASQSLSHSFINHLRNGGVNFRFFQPIFKSKYFYFGRRLHHKLLVIDGKAAMVGGINISNKYNDWNGIPAWLDFALYVKGPIARELCILSCKTWKGFPKIMGLTPCEAKEIDFDINGEEKSLVRMRRNDWVRGKKQISASYIEMLKKAKKEITILCSYFLPGHEIRNQLVRAASRGVKIKIIMAGRSDIKIAKQAERFIYKDLLENKIEIYEYQKTILHGKVMVCDREWVTIGSYNVNNISAHASIELNLDVYDPIFCGEVNDTLQNIIVKDCIRITKDWVEKKIHFLERIIQWASYEIIRFTLYLCTFYFKQQV